LSKGQDLQGSEAEKRFVVFGLTDELNWLKTEKKWEHHGQCWTDIIPFNQHYIRLILQLHEWVASEQAKHPHTIEHPNQRT
jgi:hypothetical protein